MILLNNIATYKIFNFLQAIGVDRRSKDRLFASPAF